jgi:hypothetical protein
MKQLLYSMFIFELLCFAAFSDKIVAKNSFHYKTRRR